MPNQPDENLSAHQPSVVLTVSIHAETVSRVRVVDLGSNTVSVELGDDRSGIHLLGPRLAVHRLVIEADRQLAHMAQGEDG